MEVKGKHRSAPCPQGAGRGGAEAARRWRSRCPGQPSPGPNPQTSDRAQGLPLSQRDRNQPPKDSVANGQMPPPAPSQMVFTFPSQHTANRAKAGLPTASQRGEGGGRGEAGGVRGETVVHRH